jgi:hypothetical protein
MSFLRAFLKLGIIAFCLWKRRLVARMCVPKMVKNGFNSGLPVSPVFEEDKIPKEIRNGTKSKAVPRS